MNIENLNYRCNVELFLEQIGNDNEFCKQIFIAFFANVENYFVDLKNAYENKNFVKLSKTAHTIKGSARTVCFNYLGDLASQLENKNDENLAEIEDILQKMRSEIEFLKKILSERSII